MTNINLVLAGLGLLAALGLLVAVAVGVGLEWRRAGREAAREAHQ